MKTLASLLVVSCAFAQSVTISAPVFTGAGLNDAASSGVFSLLPTNAAYAAAITATGTPDHFKWSKNGGALSAAIAITGGTCVPTTGTGWQSLSDGVKICWLASTGHTLADSWAINANARGSAFGVNTIQNGNNARMRTQEDKNRERISVFDFGALGDGVTDDTAAVLAAMNAVPSGGTLVFPGVTRMLGLKTYYRIGSLGVLTKAFTFDFDGSHILPDTTGDWVQIPLVDENDEVVFRRGTFSHYGTVVPRSIIRPTGQNNIQLETVNFWGAFCSVACLDNSESYGLRINGGSARFSQAPSIFYFEHDLGGTGFTLDASIRNFDFSNNTGKCISIEGGELSIKDGVVESCSLGGIEHVLNSITGHSWYLTLAIDHVHFEANSVHNLKFPPFVAGINANSTSSVSITNAKFDNNPSEEILYLGGFTDLILSNSLVDSACLNGDPSNAISGKVVSTNNTLFGSPASCTLGRTGRLLKTSIFGSVKVFELGDTTAFGPSEFQALNGGAADAIANFRDSTNAIKAFVDVNGNVSAKNLLPTHSMIVSNNGSFGAGTGGGLTPWDASVTYAIGNTVSFLGVDYTALLGGTGHAPDPGGGSIYWQVSSDTWACKAQFRLTTSDLDCYFDGTLMMGWANDGSYRQANMAGTGTVPVAVDSGGKVARSATIATAGTYTSVTVDAFGRVTAGTNPAGGTGFSGTKTRTECATITSGVPTACANVTETYVNGLLQ